MARLLERQFRYLSDEVDGKTALVLRARLESDSFRPTRIWVEVRWLVRYPPVGSSLSQFVATIFQGG